jgi:cytochrome oxidase Cu insertion factor (SCO1/SenC/PrrC family)
MIAILSLVLAVLPAINVTDDAGRIRSTAEWSGVPTIIAPMYARCPTTCPLIAEGLKRAVAESEASPASYRVVLFSFDPRDTPRDLRLFRERHRIPLAWSMVTTHGNDARRFLDALDYRYGDANGLFTHSNEVIVLNADLQPAKVLYGTSSSGRDLDAALAIARGRRDWLGRFGGWILALLIFVAMLAAVALVTMTDPQISQMNAD